MKKDKISFCPLAGTDLFGLYRHIAEEAGYEVAAKSYLIHPRVTRTVKPGGISFEASAMISPQVAQSK
jgi:hypothetical protein